MREVSKKLFTSVPSHLKAAQNVIICRNTHRSQIIMFFSNICNLLVIGWLRD